MLCVAVLLVACSEGPPKEEGEFRKTDLVELIDVDPSFKLDIRYATDKNFVGRPVYDEPRAFLQREAAMALVQVKKELEPLGHGLLIYDGYRPWSVTKMFWDLTPEAERAFVADPSKGSRHNRGCAVDLTLYEISSGAPVEMTSDYDAFDESAHPEYKGGTAEQREMRDLLRKMMEAQGFTVYDNEWWHYDFKDWRSYRIQNIPFNEIE